MLIADLHIHSKYSRATSRECVLEYLDFWARRKGIGLVGTGDFTHPAWREELREKLAPAEEGLYTLRDGQRLDDPLLGAAQTPRFVISGEISSIYKKNGRTRKVHNLILLPGLDAAEELSRRLEAIGNIHSDGRPILGLDSRDLLEITLEACPEAIFVPAHIWTPHFSLFGAFSGFDTIQECYEDLTPHIHALETGLSSDPPMNWRLSALDSYTLISNSDAHSPAKLGREANLLDIELSYPALSAALAGGVAAGFVGTIEFFPEEGKYHCDGHRNCNLCLTPAETAELGGKCPVCGKKLTIGVLNRVEQLADRAEGFTLPGAGRFESLAPLTEVIGGSTGLAPAGVQVNQQYQRMLHELGNEFHILREASPDDIERCAGACVAEGIRRLRAGRVERIPGYDGEYGIIRLLSPAEIDSLSGQMCLFGESGGGAKKPAKRNFSKRVDAEAAEEIAAPVAEALNDEQQQAVTATQRTVAVIAGPGTGKTKTLVSRIAHLIEQRGVQPAAITAVTFTNQAAKEMRERLQKRLPRQRGLRSMRIGTFHSLCLEDLVKRRGGIALADEYQTAEFAAQVIAEAGVKITPRNFLQAVSQYKNCPGEEGPLSPELLQRYADKLERAGVMDFDDLLLNALKDWESCTEKKDFRPFSYLLVDEFQDINDIQYRLVRAWSRYSKSLFVIGDPDQAIYGFRGSDAQCFERLAADDPDLLSIRLLRNYRSTPEIVGCALPVISQNAGSERILSAQRAHGEPVRILTAESELSEAIFVAKEINRMTGGVDMLDAQAYSHGQSGEQARSFSDCAVLYRTHRQAKILEHCLRRESIPYVVAGRDDFLASESVRAAVAFFRFLLAPADLLSLRVCLKLLWALDESALDSVCAAWESLGVTELTPEILAALPDSLLDVGHLAPWLALCEKYLPRVRREKPQKLLESWAKDVDPAAEPLEKLIHTAIFHKDMPSFLNQLLLGSESDLMRCGGKLYAAGAVTLMTLHGSKGLEFPVVFLCGVRKGVIPLESVRRPADLSEERRLFYVGMTRAKDELLLLTSPEEPSPFLKDIPATLCRAEEARKKKMASDGVQLSMF